jgi:hypothetical protein
MGSKPNKVNSVATPADMLEKIAATNDLTIEDVVRLFLIEALPEGKCKLGTLELSRASPCRFPYENRTLPR